MTEYGELKDNDENSGSKDDGHRIDCLKCKNFKTTWNPKFPRACTVFGFKGKELPSATVFRVTGKPCPSFDPVPGSNQDE